jgi:ACS family sodium-dependent inorganic phosphate cotransporter
VISWFQAFAFSNVQLVPLRAGLFCGHADLSVKYASIMLGVTNTLAAIASTLSTFFTGYFFSATGGNWALSLFIPIAVFQAVSVIIFAVLWDSDPVDFDAIQAKKTAAA